MVYFCKESCRLEYVSSLRTESNKHQDDHLRLDDTTVSTFSVSCFMSGTMNYSYDLLIQSPTT